MSDPLNQLVENWRAVGSLLEAMRDRDLIDAPLPVAMVQLADMVDSAIFLKPLLPSSGMVEMQQGLARLR